VPSLIVLAGVIEFFNIFFCPPLIALFLPFLFFFEAFQIAIEIHILDLSIPILLEHFPFTSFI
jgi:hypothetical protein